MATFDYNPITGQLDLVGSGASYINGVVADPTALPVTLGTPPLDSVYLAKAGSGVWLINRRPAGLYVRVANNGVAADWTYLGAFPEVNADGNWELYNSTDPTKELKFDLSGLPTGTTRTVTGPAGNGQMMVSGQAGSFTTLTANNGTLTASAPVLDLAQTWNNAAVTFTGLRFAITNTASSSTSNILQVDAGASGTTSTFSIRRDGAVTALNSINVAGGGTMGGPALTIAGTQFRGGSNCSFAWTGTANNAYGSSADLILLRDAANTLAQYNGTNPQAYNIYNTFTSSTNHERGFLRWSSNVFQIGTEAGSGGGTVRNLEIRIGAQSGGAVFSASGSGIRMTCRDVSVGFGYLTNNLSLIDSSGTWQCRNAANTSYTTLEAQFRAQGTAPATSGATGTAGDIRYDADYIYVCTATNTWKRAAIATW